jgi:hypothetical protein
MRYCGRFVTHTALKNVRNKILLPIHRSEILSKILFAYEDVMSRNHL